MTREWDDAIRYIARPFTDAQLDQFVREVEAKMLDTEAQTFQDRMNGVRCSSCDDLLHPPANGAARCKRCKGLV